jgi:multimeric flavodoxin WrbA
MALVLGICGSSRKNGRTASLVRKVLQHTGLATELIFLSDLSIGFCYGCLSCAGTKGVCVRDDDMAPLLDTMLSADALVLGTPNYYYCI